MPSQKKAPDRSRRYSVPAADFRNDRFSIAASLPARPGNRSTLLRWTVVFLLVAIIAAVFGFGGIASEAAWIAKVLLFVFLVFFVVSLVLG